MNLAFLKLVSFAATIKGCNPNKDNPNNSFFNFPHWYQYISDGDPDIFGKCSPKVVFPDGIWAIALAVVDMLLYLAGIVAVFMIIASGISYLTSLGNVEKATSARKRLVNTVIGLVIVITASLVVSFIGNYVAK